MDNYQSIQKEIFGNIAMINPFRDSQDRIIWNMKIDNIQVGENCNVFFKKDVKIYPISFHTHPQSLYEKLGVNIGYPSSMDYFFFLEAVLDYKAIFHIVSSVEGLYLIFLGEYWHNKKEDLRQYILLEKEKILKKLEVPKNMIEKENIESYISNYLDYINNLDENPLLKVFFFSWDDDIDFVKIEIH